MSLFKLFMIIYAAIMLTKNVALQDSDIKSLFGEYHLIFGVEDAFDTIYVQDENLKLKQFDSFKDVFVRYWLYE